MTRGGSRRIEEWAENHLRTLAERHFPGRREGLVARIGELAEAHETRWRSEGTGVYRPTVSMYALALGWTLRPEGPRCAVCHGPVAPPPARGAVEEPGSRLALAPRVPVGKGGLNVPQNLVLGHAACLERL